MIKQEVALQLIEFCLIQFEHSVLGDAEVPMMDCKYITRDMLTHPVMVTMDDKPLDFSNARVLADRKARELSSDPMLLAWFDRASGRFSPDVICCDQNKPTWLIYAESRGADIEVDINNEDYVFVYKGAME
jgi:hypothetical protein